MKINQPITNKEVDFSDNLNILSTTDTKGQITYVNQDFMDVSGFDQAELVGESHNVVRHPDMPPAAFNDLWETIKNDHSWMGIVKNRCKNGDHYWVNAFVTPIKKDGKVVEFQSVRTKPSKNDTERAEKLYQGLAENKKPFVLKLPSLTMNMKLGIISFFALLPLLGFALLSGVSLTGALLVFILSFSMAISGIWYVTRYLRKAVAMASDIVDNELQQILYTGTRDEGGKIILAMKMLKTEIDAIAGRIVDSADQLRKTAEELSSNVALTNQGVTHQNSETENLTTAMHEMLSTSKEVADHAQLAAEAANNASDSASEGQQVVSDTIASINHLASQVQHSSEVIKRLEQDSDNIGSILDVIKTIAEQTNLLALNAAIEAARAGEQGRGFAVVADEVRSLASRTQESTQEIESMIERLQAGARDAVSVMAEGCEKAEQGVQHAAKADVSLKTITDSVNSIKDMNSLIASAAEEQSSVANEVTQNVSVITEVSELTVDTLEYSSQISHELDGVSSMLYELANHFRTLAR